VGPAQYMELDFGERLNVITGDNGLGKSFLLDIIWWTLTRKWPSEVNSNLTAGKMALPTNGHKASINFTIVSETKDVTYLSEYQKKEQVWTGKVGRPLNPGLVLYAMSDGSFALWDPARNYWTTRNNMDLQERTPAYVFNPLEVWNGLLSKDGKWISNGLIRDLASWQREEGTIFSSFKDVLKILSASDEEILCPGELTRISIDDARDIPTLKMAYGIDVPLLHASSGMRRIVALAYLMVWAWEEHKKAAKQIGEENTSQIIFLIDEIEAHLHPRWQRRIVPALLTVMNTLTTTPKVQLISATHAPLVMASLEPVFDEDKDAWFDIDYENASVYLRRRNYEKHGDAETWLISEAFDLKSSRAPDYEKLISEASGLLNQAKPTPEEVIIMNTQLGRALNPGDKFLFRWQYICRQKGWIK